MLAVLGFYKEANLSVFLGALVFFVIALYGYLTGVVETLYFVWAVIFAEASVFILRAYFALTIINMANFKNVKRIQYEGNPVSDNAGRFLAIVFY